MCGRFGIIYFNCLGNVCVFCLCLCLCSLFRICLCILFFFLCLCSHFHSFHLGLCVRMSEFNFMF